MKCLLLLVLALSLPLLRAQDATSLEFLEAFGWGDREAAIRMLAPNTEDFHYFNSLHHQLSGNPAALQESLNVWRGFLGRSFPSQRYNEIVRRQALLDFDSEPEAAWALIRRELSLRFNHQRRTDARASTYPTRVDPQVYSLAAFRNQAASNTSFPSYSDRGLELLDPATLNQERRRIYLSKITRPDFPGLLPLILEDLANDKTPGFGALPIHNLLTRAQLEELAQRRPELLRSAEYVNQRLGRIPAPDTDLSHDHAAAVAHFTRIWDFVRTLEPMHNSLKASTLFRLMDHQRHLGIYDEALFRAYLDLPRQVHYLPRPLREELQRRNTDWVNFGFQPGNNIILPPIGDESPLVREFLLHFLKDASSPAAFERWFEEGWLNAIFAESKILHGIGRPEDQAGRLNPSAYRALLDRVELNFAATNASYIKPGEPVELSVDLKRVDSIRIKIYQLQTFNYYSTRRQPVDQAVDLDGLVATHERVLETGAPPGQRIRHSLAFPEITERGVYVVELIGGGVSSRALLHIGQLESVSQATAAGQAVMILNESGEHVKDAVLWLDGRDFTPDENGIILLPYSENPGLRFAILRQGDFNYPERIQHLGEVYAFTAGIHLDAQNLPRRRRGSLILRPDLRVNSMPLDPALLGEVTVTLASVDAKGTRTEREFTAKFTRNREWRREFYVPDDTRRFEVKTRATLRRRIDGERITLEDSYALDVNPARTTATLSQIFLQPTSDGWFLEVRGLNGEPIADLPLNLRFNHPGFSVHTQTQVATDAAGRVALGHLRDVSQIHANGSDNLRLTQTLSVARAVLPEQLHVRENEAISLAYPFENTTGLTPASLLRLERGAVQAIVNDSVRINDSELRVAGLPAGEYELRLHEAGRIVRIRVGEGELRLGYIFGPRLRLQETVATMPSLQEVRRQADSVRIQIRNRTASTRVLVRASRYAGPGGEIAPGFGYTPPARRSVHPPHTQYVSGRNIGDEYRYVLDRQGLEVFAGTLLTRPGLILNPWELRETVAEQERLKADAAYRGGRQRMAEAAAMPARMMADRGQLAPGVGGRTDAGNQIDIGFDFLPQGSQWMSNLLPDANGVLDIPLANLAEQTVLDIIVLDRFGTSRSRVTLPDRDFEPREVRLLAGLNPEGSFSRQKTMRALDADGEATLPDLATSRYMLIRSFGQAYDLLRTLGGQPELAEFDFLKSWPTLDENQQRAKYGEFASHEMHLFLYARDRAFFDAVVRPYLANKKDSTFVDRWLLDALTPDDLRLDTLQNRNALELALLARRGGNRDAVLAALREQVELLPPDPEGFARLVRVALQAADLDETAAQDRKELQEKAIARSDMMRVGAEMTRSIPTPADSFAAGAAMPASTAAPAARREMSLREEVMDDAIDLEAPAEMNGRLSLIDGDPFGYAAPAVFRALPKTKEWAEQNYYKLRVQADVPGRIPANAFWLEVASGAPLSAELLRAHGSLTEALTALAFSGLPFDTEGEVVEQLEGAALTLRSPGPALLVTEQILPAEDADDDRPLLISQQFYRPDDRYRHEGNEQIEKFITGEFIRRVVYGGRVTLTNPTANRRRLNVLMQIPQGSIPVSNGFYTDDRDVLLEPYTTRTIEFAFYFPFSGEYAQFPAHAAADEAIIGRAENRIFRVVDAPTEIDRGSWGWISQNGSNEEVFAFLDTHNLRRLDLNEMAWRLSDREVFERAAELFASRLHWHDTTYSYAIYHKDVPRARGWLARSAYANMVGPVLDSPLLSVDPVERKTYEHLEYDPLVNPRAHRVGETRTILNSAVNQQYRGYLGNALYIGELSSRDRLGLIYYLLLQDRLAEARGQIAQVNTDDVHERLQLDYLNAWLSLRVLETDRAIALATPHLQHPVPRWRERFTALHNAVLEARGEVAGEVDDPDRQQHLDRAAAGAPSLEIKQDGGRILVYAANLPEAILNLYPMDIELLFSRRPFQTDGGDGFAIIRPAFSGRVALPVDDTEHELELPAEFRERNVVVELSGLGLRESVSRFANRLTVRVIQSFGQIEVRSSTTGELLPRTYIKVYARGVDGRESFWKDGYTDLRGRFDYLSLNDRQPEEAVRFSILVLHSEHGAVIRETTPPTR